jgi:hypothetical protein
MTASGVKFNWTIRAIVALIVVAAIVGRVWAVNEPGTLIQRLRLPLWCHSNSPFEGPQLAKEETLADLRKAADTIDALERALQAAQGKIMNARIDLQTGHTKAAVNQTLEGIVKFIDEALAQVKP